MNRRLSSTCGACEQSGRASGAVLLARNASGEGWEEGIVVPDRISLAALRQSCPVPEISRQIRRLANHDTLARPTSQFWLPRIGRPQELDGFGVRQSEF